MNYSCGIYEQDCDSATQDDSSSVSNTYNAYQASPHQTASGLQDTYSVTNAYQVSERTTSGLEGPQVDTKFSSESSEDDDFSDVEMDEGNLFFKSFQGVNKLKAGSVHLDHYICHGAFGQVFLAQWNQLPTAIKKLDLNHANRNFPQMQPQEIQETLSWEISRLSAVSHPNVVQFYGIYQNKPFTRTFVVMEYCEGGELMKVLKKSAPSWKNKWEWSLQMTAGLLYLHCCGVLHRDLKAENVLLDRFGRAKLADLGVAQVDSLIAEKEAKVVAQGLQDQRFIAPENLSQATLSNKATDIYALGLVFWQLLSLSVPKHPAELGPVLKSLWLTEPNFERESIPPCNPKYRRIILSCWALNPSERPTAEDILSNLKNSEMWFEVESERKWMDFVITCEKLEDIIHPKKLEGFDYLQPYVTAHQVMEPIENYWKRYEYGSDFKEIKTGNPPLELSSIHLEFLHNPDDSVLLFEGASGLGKTLSSYLLAAQLMQNWWSYLAKPTDRPPILPIFVRAACREWSRKELENCFPRVLQYYGLKEDNLPPLLLIVDAIDECSDVYIHELESFIDLMNIPMERNIKLMITTRPNIVDEILSQKVFKFWGNIRTFYFLNFNLPQVFNYLEKKLDWTQERRAELEKTLTSSPNLVSVLRNPFVLQLFVKSFETVSKKDLKKLTRWDIYEGFVEHWIKTDKDLLAEEVQDLLCVGSTGLSESYNSFATEVANLMFQKKELLITIQNICNNGLTHSPWLNLADIVKKDCQSKFRGFKITFTKRKETDISIFKYNIPTLIQQVSENNERWYIYGLNEQGSPKLTQLIMEDILEQKLNFEEGKTIFLSDDQNSELFHQIRSQNGHVKDIRRNLLQMDDYIQIKISNLTQFSSNSPLKSRKNSLEFNHKSFMEYFIVRYFLSLLQTKNVSRLCECLSSISLVSEPAVLSFWKELKEVLLPDESFVEPLFEVIYKTKNRGESYSGGNAATLLNYWKIPFSGKDLSYSVMINADFSNGILDGTNLLGAKLIHANFSGSVLRNTDFTHCDLHTVEFGEFPVVSLVDTPCGITFGHDANTFFVAGVSKCLCYANGKISKITTNSEITSIAYNLAHDALAVSTTENVSFIWLKTGEKREICKQQQKLKFSLDGQYFVTCKRKIISVWSFSGSLLFELDQYSVILFLEFSPKLDFLISCSSKQIYVWDMKERKLIKSFPNPSPIRYMAINPTHSHLLAVAGDDMIIYLWDLRTSVNFTNLTGHFEKIRQLKFSPDGSLLASASGGTRSRDNSVRVWSISNYSLYATFAGHTESVVGVDISPEGLLVSCSYDNTVRRTKIYSKRNTIAEVGPSAAINCGCWSSDGNFFAITCDDNTVTLFSAKCYQLLHTIPTNSSAYMAQFSGDCSILVAIDVSGSVFILSTKDFSLKTIVLGSQLLLLTLAVSPDGSEIFIGGPTTKVHIKDGIPKVSKGDVISYCLCYTPTGKYLLTSTVKGLQVQCNQTVKSISLSSCGNAIFSPDGKSIAVALYDHIQLFSVDLEEKQTLQGVDNSEILALAFNPSGSILVSQGRNHKICVWDVLKGVLISELSLHSGVTAFGAFSPDGQRYLSVSWDQSFTIWKVREGEEWIVIWRFSQSPGLVAKAAKIPVNKLSYNNKQLLKQYGALMVD